MPDYVAPEYIPARSDFRFAPTIHASRTPFPLAIGSTSSAVNASRRPRRNDDAAELISHFAQHFTIAFFASRMRGRNDVPRMTIAPLNAFDRHNGAASSQPPT